MVTDLLFRVACHGGTEEPLNVHLKRLTDSAYTRKSLGGLDVAGELLAPVIAESHDGESRREIMRFLRECMSEPNGKRWQRIYGGLALTEYLMQHGSPALVIEAAHGHYFDLVQKVSLLEQFDAAARGCTDKRAQNVVRKKASELRAMLVPRLQRASTELLPQGFSHDIKDTTSNCSAGGMSTATGASSGGASTATPSGSSNADGADPESASFPSAPGTPQADAPSDRSPRSGLAGSKAEVSAATAELGQLQVELSNLTDSALVDAPQKLPASIVEASHDVNGRQVIMEHMRSCLIESSPTQWHRVNNGLSLVEVLIVQGSPLIFAEAARSLRFNLPQQIWNLQQFEHLQDWRVQQMVRKKACRLHDLLIQRLVSIDSDRFTQDMPDRIDDAFSSLRTWVETAGSSPSSVASRTSSRAFSTAAGSCEDTDDDSEGWLPIAGRPALSPLSKIGSRNWAESGDNTSDAGFFTPMPASAFPSSRVTQLDTKLSL